MASDPSDWDPLPDLGTALHPGESVAWAARRNAPGAPAEPQKLAVTPGNVPVAPQPMATTPPGGGTAAGYTVPPAAPAARSTVPVAGRGNGHHSAPPTAGPMSGSQPGSTSGAPSWRDARADALLQGMRQRLAAAPPTQSLAAMMRQNEVRREAQAAAVAAMPTPARPARADVVQEAAPLPTAYAEGRDARQDEPWFRALPVAEQERLTRVWDQERRRFHGVPARRRQELLEWFWVAYVVFFLAAMPMMLVEGLNGFVRMAMAGCVAGLVWNVVPRDRFWCVTSAVVVYALVVVVPRVSVLVTSVLDSAVALGSGCLVAYLAALGAMHEEMQRSGMMKQSSS
jgi:hypothetical protein